ncbi:MAG: DUF1735 domain-containing protein [Phocaeicola plebeius]|nr:DUF1735 domain-containing protein [Phocaeicola plebeius]
MKTRFISLLLVALVAVTSTSCLKDDYLFDYDNMKSVIELPYLDHSKSFSYKDGATSVSTELYVNYSIANWRDIKEDIPVELSIDESLLGGAKLLPASAYNLKFPLTMTILRASEQEKLSQLVHDGEKLNWQSAQELLTINLTDPNLVSGTKYALPLTISSVPSQYTISGNFRNVVFYVTIH